MTLAHPFSAQLSVCLLLLLNSFTSYAQQRDYRKYELESGILYYQYQVYRADSLDFYDLAETDTIVVYFQDYGNAEQIITQDLLLHKKGDWQWQDGVKTARQDSFLFEKLALTKIEKLTLSKRSNFWSHTEVLKNEATDEPLLFQGDKVKATFYHNIYVVHRFRKKGELGLYRGIPVYGRVFLTEDPKLVEMRVFNIKPLPEDMRWD